MEKVESYSWRRRRLLPSLVLAFSVFALMLLFSASPVSADSHTNQFIEDGGGPRGPHKVWGYVLEYHSPFYWDAAPGVSVYLYGSASPWYTETDENGRFAFYYDTIQPNMNIMITVNGYIEWMGVSTDFATWGQWKGYAHTDNIAYAYKEILIEPATIVNVPAAVLYSNTAYTQSAAYSSGSSHNLGFRATVGSTGYMTSQRWVQGIVWTIYGHHTAQYGRQYYAVSYYDQIFGVDAAGLSSPVDEYEEFHTMDVPEYLTPDLSKPNYGLPTDATPISFVIGGSESASFQYTETGSFTWSRGFSGSVGIGFDNFSLSINIDVTSTDTSGHTTVINFTVGPLPPGTPHHKFVIYTRGFSFTMPKNNPNDPNNKGGLELHIWDAGETT